MATGYPSNESIIISDDDDPQSKISNRYGNNGKNNNCSLDQLPDENDPNFYCRVCRRTLSRKRNYQYHLMAIHSMNITSNNHNKMKHLDLSPDVNDVNFYCRACEKTLSDKKHYRIHLAMVHGTNLDRKRDPIIMRHPHILPDIDDPNNYCRTCEHTFSCRRIYRSHLQSVHEITHPAIDIPHPMIRNRHLIPDKDDLNFYCRACEKSYAHRENLRRHLQSVHRMILGEKALSQMSKEESTSSDTDEEGEEETMESVLSSYVIPDKNDPNFLCNACGNTFASKGIYHDHLQKVHKFVVSLPFLTLR